MAVDYSSLLNIPDSSVPVGLLILLVAVAMWKLIWYGLALYKTIERKQIKWFVVLFVAAFTLGDLGILAIIYLMIHRRKKSNQAKRK